MAYIEYRGNFELLDTFTAQQTGTALGKDYWLKVERWYFNGKAL